MNDLDHAVLSAVRARAEEAGMSTDTTKEFGKLTTRLDEADTVLRRRRWVIAGAAVAAAAAAILVVAGAWRGSTTTTPPQPAQTPARQFTSTSFGVPFSAIRPAWTDIVTSDTSPTAEAPGWVTWNRCPDNAVECIGLSFNRYVAIDLPDRRQTVTRTSYLAYLEGLRKAGRIDITDRTTTSVDGRRATVLSITARTDLPNGLGCHADFTCDEFFAGVPGRYAIIDTTGLDGEGAVLVVWTRAGAVSTAETTWLQDFDRMLGTIRFRSAASVSPS